jgi:hypothetical protein
VADDLISEAAAAAILGVSHQRVIQIRVEGKLEPIKTAGPGRTRIVYRRADVERRASSVERGVGRYGRTYRRSHRERHTRRGLPPLLEEAQVNWEFKPLASDP